VKDPVRVSEARKMLYSLYNIYNTTTMSVVCGGTGRVKISGYGVGEQFQLLADWRISL